MDVWRVALGLALQKSLWYGSGHGAVRILRRQGCSGRGHGSSRARCCGAAALGRVGCAPSQSCVPRPVRQGVAPCRGAGRDVACVAGLDGGGVQGRGSRCVDRLVTRAAVCPVASDRCGQDLDKCAALDHPFPTLGTLAPTSSPPRQQSFLRKATSPRPEASRIAPSSRQIRLRNNAVKSRGDPTR